jgi:hypothetical protein
MKNQIILKNYKKIKKGEKKWKKKKEIKKILKDICYKIKMNFILKNLYKIKINYLYMKEKLNL